MSTEAHIEQLTLKHHELEAAVDEENQRPVPDDSRLKVLKLEKLRIKDEISRLTAQH
jgi:hypothetical protein